MVTTFGTTTAIVEGMIRRVEKLLDHNLERYAKRRWQSPLGQVVCEISLRTSCRGRVHYMRRFLLNGSMISKHELTRRLHIVLEEAVKDD